MRKTQTLNDNNTTVHCMKDEKDTYSRITNWIFIGSSFVDGKHTGQVPDRRRTITHQMEENIDARIMCL